MFKIILMALLLTQVSSYCAAKDDSEFIFIEKDETMHFLEKKFDNIGKKLQDFVILHLIIRNNEKMANQSDRLNALEKRVDAMEVIESKLNTIEIKLEHLATLQNMETIIQKLDKIEEILSNIEVINKRLESLEATGEDIKKIKIENFQKLPENIEIITKKFDVVEEKLNNIQDINKRLETSSEDIKKNITHFEGFQKLPENIEFITRKLQSIEEIFNRTEDINKISNEDIKGITLKFQESHVQCQQIKGKLDDVKTSTININQQLSTFFNNSICAKAPTNCVGATELTRSNGIYNIQVDKYSAKPFAVSCEVNKEGQGWLVIQRRQDGSVDFYRDWNEYKRGFGNLNGEFWIGLDKLHALTNSSQQELLIFMEDFENKKFYAKYDAFAIGDESEKYALTVLGKFAGDAGDSLTYHLGMKFTTKDNKNDLSTGGNCALNSGAWWHNNCYRSNLNGMYFSKEHAMNIAGICWIDYKVRYSLKFVQMMIRPKTI